MQENNKNVTKKRNTASKIVIWMMLISTVLTVFASLISVLPTLF